MANRVVLGAFDGTYVLRVSKPGQNVLTTGLAPKFLAFDSRWSDVGDIFSRGVTTVTPTANANVTIPYGTTLSPAPIVIATIRNSASTGYQTLTSQAHADNPPIGFRRTAFFVGNTECQIQFINMFDMVTLSATSTIYYTIMRNVYG